MPLPPLAARRVGTVAQETHVDAEEEEDEPIEDDAMQPVRTVKMVVRSHRTIEGTIDE